MDRRLRPYFVLTVGANDIDFADCLKSIIEDGDLSLTSKSDPCTPKNLRKSLAVWEPNLKSDLTTLKGKYPGVPIMVMDYYNPFPQAPTGVHLACAFSTLATLFYEHAQLGWAGAVYMAVEEPALFALEARTVQGRIYKDAGSVLGQVNASINAAASGLATVVNTNDFAGHDICSSDQWVFSPTAQIDMSLSIATITKSAHLSIGGDEVCPDPIPPLDENITVSKHFSEKFVGLSGSVHVVVGTNCLPHLTERASIPALT